jgi:hypothetical protein
MMLDNAREYGLKHVVLPNTTLNEKFDRQVVLPDDVPNPITQYFCIGLNYDDILEDDTIDLDNVRHDVSHGALFRHAPLIARKATDQFTVDELAKYRMRVTKRIGGEDYVFFMLKKIDSVFESGKILHIPVEDGEGSVELFSTIGSEILNPTPNTRDEILNSDLSYLKYSNTLQVSLNEEEKVELENACHIYYENDETIDLRELALVSGIDYTYNGVLDAYNTQVMYFEKVDYLLDDNNLNVPFRHTMEIGGMSPMVYKTYTPTS